MINSASHTFRAAFDHFEVTRGPITTCYHARGLVQSHAPCCSYLLVCAIRGILMKHVFSIPVDLSYSALRLLAMFSSFINQARLISKCCYRVRYPSEAGCEVLGLAYCRIKTHPGLFRVREPHPRYENEASRCLKAEEVSRARLRSPDRRQRLSNPKNQWVQHECMQQVLLRRVLIRRSEACIICTVQGKSYSILGSPGSPVQEPCSTKTLYDNRERAGSCFLVHIKRQT